MVLAGAVPAVLAIAPAPAAGADIVVPLPLPLPPIEIPDPLPVDPTPPPTIPDPTTTTTTAPPVTTTTTVAPTTTTTRPRPTTTTRPRPTTTTRPRSSTTTSTRPVAAVTPGGRSGDGASPTARAGGSPSRATNAAGASNARRTARRAAVRATRAGSREPLVSTGPGARADAGSAGARTPLLPTERVRRAVPSAGDDRGSPQRHDGTLLAGLLLAAATAVVLGLAQRDVAGQRRSELALVGPAALRLGRDDDEADVRTRLQLMLASGPVAVSGSDCRALQLLVRAAAHEGLEVRDPRGFVVRATNRLQRAYGAEPDSKRLPLRWSVEITRPTMEIPEGFEFALARTGADDQGRVLAFTPGTDVLLWSGDCL
jgi:hypothetical protein